MSKDDEKDDTVNAALAATSVNILMRMTDVDPALAATLAPAAGLSALAALNFAQRVYNFIHAMFVSEYARLRGVTPAQADVEMASLMNDVVTADAVNRALDEARKASHSTAISALAALLDMYVNPEARAADEFFRETALMISGCDGQTISDLGTTIRAIRALPGGAPEVTIIAVHRRDANASPASVTPVLTVRDESDHRNDPSAAAMGSGKVATVVFTQSTGTEVVGVPRDRAVRVVERLTKPGVGERRTETGAEGVALSHQTVARLAVVFEVMP